MDPQVKGVIFSSAQEQLKAMCESGAIRVTEGDEPACLIEKIDPARWYTLAELNDWTRQIRDLVGASNLVAFGTASAELLGRTGIYAQFEVTLEEQGFSLGSKLLLTFAGISHPYTEWSFAEADESRGVVIDVTGSAGWNDEQSEITLGWVSFLAQKMLPGSVASAWQRLASGDVRYRLDVVGATADG